MHFVKGLANYKTYDPNIKYLLMDKVWLQLYLIFLLYVNFDKSTIELLFLLITSILAKFLEDQRLILMSSIKCLNFKFLYFKIMDKKLVYGLNSNWHEI